MRTKSRDNFFVATWFFFAAFFGTIVSIIFVHQLTVYLESGSPRDSSKIKKTMLLCFGYCLFVIFITLPLHKYVRKWIDTVNEDKPASSDEERY